MYTRILLQALGSAQRQWIFRACARAHPPWEASSLGPELLVDLPSLTLCRRLSLLCCSPQELSHQLVQGMQAIRDGPTWVNRLLVPALSFQVRDPMKMRSRQPAATNRTQRPSRNRILVSGAAPGVPRPPLKPILLRSKHRPTHSQLQVGL